MSRRLLTTPFLLVGLALLTQGCGRTEPIVTYSVPKEQVTATPARPMSGGMTDDGIMTTGEQDESQLPLSWTLPAGWEQSFNPGSIRTATIRSGGENGLEVSVTWLAGEAGGLTANVNRWRQQLELEPVDFEGVQATTRAIEDGQMLGLVVDLMGPEPVSSADRQDRMLVGKFEHEGKTWFFKVRQPVSVVAEHEAAFMELLRSVRPSENPEAGQFVDYTAGEVSGLIPSTWTQQPAGPMQVALFSISGGPQTGEVIISRFPGDVGGELANINRWRQQVGLDPADDAARDEGMQVPVGGLTAKIYKFTGPGDAADRKGILVASVPRGDETWFFKMAGPWDLLTAQAHHFVTFLASTKFTAEDTP